MLRANARAAKNYCASNSIGLNGQLFLAGYSQGGDTVMALDRDLERYYTNEFTVTACAPMAGPYDLSGVELNDILSPRCPPNPYYAAYVLVAYHRDKVQLAQLAVLIIPGRIQDAVTRVSSEKPPPSSQPFLTGFCAFDLHPLWGDKNCRMGNPAREPGGRLAQANLEENNHRAECNVSPVSIY